jgi:hypothetical protein
MERELKVGQHLVFVDAERKERDALLLCIHGDPRGAQRTCRTDEKGEYISDEKGVIISDEVEGTAGSDWPCINIVVVRDNPSAQDQYGRETTKEHTSVVHWTYSSAQGYCWRFADEEMSGEAAPPIS